jgi:hypothetical protein
VLTCRLLKLPPKSKACVLLPQLISFCLVEFLPRFPFSNDTYLLYCGCRDYKLHLLKRDARAKRRLTDDWIGLLKRGELTRKLIRQLWVGVTDMEFKFLLGILEGLGNGFVFSFQPFNSTCSFPPSLPHIKTVLKSILTVQFPPSPSLL